MVFKSSMLASVVGSLVLSLVATAPQAQEFPDRPLTIVVPAGTGGTNDRSARLMAGFLAEELGQPVQIVNRPGGGNMLGHMYFIQQPADGYTLLRTTAMPYLTANALSQGADFEVEQFHPINITDIGTSIIATSTDSRFNTIAEVIAEIREKPGTVSVGVQPTATDYINFSIFLEALGLSLDDVRIVTYDSGGPVRNGIVGAQFDIGVVGDQGMSPLKGQLKTLMSFSEERSAIWDAPTVVEVAKAEGIESYTNILSGSMQGFLVHTDLIEAHPDRYKAILEAFQRVAEDPEAIEAYRQQDLGVEWIGPEVSTQLMMRQHELISQPEILSRIQQD